MKRVTVILAISPYYGKSPILRLCGLWRMSTIGQKIHCLCHIANASPFEKKGKLGKDERMDKERLRF